MSSPRLLHVFSSFAVGGAQVRFCTLANSFGPDWRHDIVAMDGNVACRERLRPGLAVRFPDVAVRKGDTFGNVRRFRAALRALRPDVLVTYNFGAIEWAIANALVGLRHVHIEDGFGPEERTTQILRRVLLRRIFLRRATVVLPSQNLWRIATGIWRLDARRVRYIPNGIDLTCFAPSETARAAGTPVIGTVAALRAEKNLARLVRAFALARRDRPARLVVVGDGPERPALEDLARTLGVGGDVRFAGHLAEPRHAYAAFDIFALSSDTEQMPLSLLEAMAAGLPVAATDVGDVAFMLAEANRRFVTALDDAALAVALASLLDQPALRRELGAANRARAERDYDQQTMVDAYARLFRG
jgi:glycosyltransferase involved in cell wall biosynthesis